MGDRCNTIVHVTWSVMGYDVPCERTGEIGIMGPQGLEPMIDKKVTYWYNPESRTSNAQTNGKWRQ